MLIQEAADGFFTGSADEIRVWNRELSSQEVQNAYTNGQFAAPQAVLHVASDSSSPPPPSPYHYEPFIALSGSNFLDTASTPQLQLPKFSVGSWFQTSNAYTTNGHIVNKGGSGSETAGRNMNYGIWMNSAEKIQAGFETSAGADFYVTSPLTYNDDQWHYAVVTYDGSAATLRLYIDGVLVASKSTSAEHLIYSISTC